MRLPLVALTVLASLASLGPAAAGGKWSIARSPRFVVLGETDEKTVRDAARQLEQFRCLAGALTAALSATAGTSCPPGSSRCRCCT